jgi:hypothetical protein
MPERLLQWEYCNTAKFDDFTVFPCWSLFRSWELVPSLGGCSVDITEHVTMPNFKTKNEVASLSETSILQQIYTQGHNQETHCVVYRHM